ncbi:DUF624 domain-containing protein [Paractinoplanes toevensis]|uniref:DUF624 domain-containing protein n=1 Tax=Paractinoplanes toevensis TaxID=571911 RepID=A0A919WD19_9ACTN|nr:DUF624 domain-containing protein [Actinoplanes toevensis]GIM98017.1 hypothetical protein Ato02nite_098100 [Actinoplanes toevensis]
MPHSVRLAADLALLGIVVTLLSLPLFTAGAAVAAGSYAIAHQIAQGRWPSFIDLWVVFRRRLLPGLIAGPAIAVAITLVVIDVAALRRGAVPGGGPILTAVLAASAFVAGYIALVAVRAGVVDSGGAARSALSISLSRPAAPLAAAAVLALTALLAWFVHPVLVPVLAGYALFALHVVTSRIAGHASVIDSPVA